MSVFHGTSNVRLCCCCACGVVGNAGEAGPSRDLFAQSQEARSRTFLRNENGRIDRSGGVVERDDEVEIVIERRYPAMGRAILEQTDASPTRLAPRLSNH